MTAVRILWVLIKSLLSVTLVLFSGTLVYFSLVERNFSDIGFAAFLAILATLPWIRWGKFSQAPWSVLSVMKLLFSALFVALSGTMVQLFFAESEFAALGLAGICIIVAVSPWMNWTEPNRELGLAFVFISLCPVLLAYNRLVYGVFFPQVCAGRRWFLCQLENTLFDVGGIDLVIYPWLAFSALLLAFGIRSAFRDSRWFLARRLD